jgi:hypothetical protein
MADVFTPVIERLRDIGAFKFLFPYMLSSAVFYGLLRKSQVFGKGDENAAVNAVVALIASLMVWGYPIITGVDIETQLAAFFTQGLVVTLVFMVALLVVGMFLPPDLPKHLADNLFKGNKAGAIVVVGVVLGLIILGTSGLWNVLFGPEVFKNTSGDTILAIGVIVLLVVPVIFITYGGGKEAPPVKSEEKKE